MIQSNNSALRLAAVLSAICTVQRPGYGSVCAATRGEESGPGSPRVSTKYDAGSSAFFLGRRKETQAKRCRLEKEICVF